MSVDILPDAPAVPEHETRSAATRRDHILDAFERCMHRSGFHRTTMQDVAKEAGMSAGNLYRYFASKEAIVEDLAERDRVRFRADFVDIARGPDVLGAFIGLDHRHFVEEPRSRCIQFLEIWAEATRNPAVARVCDAMDREVNRLLIDILEAAKAAGQIPQAVDSASAVEVLSAMIDGLFTRKALDPDFDPEAGFRLVKVLLAAIIEGRVDFATPATGGTAVHGDVPTTPV